LVERVQQLLLVVVARVFNRYLTGVQRSGPGVTDRSLGGLHVLVIHLKLTVTGYSGLLGSLADLLGRQLLAQVVEVERLGYGGVFLGAQVALSFVRQDPLRLVLGGVTGLGVLLY